MITLREQLRQVAIAHVNEPWFNACGAPRAATELAAKAFLEDWPRDGFDARVVLEFCRRMLTAAMVPMDCPGVANAAAPTYWQCSGCFAQEGEGCRCGCDVCGADPGVDCYCRSTAR